MWPTCSRGSWSSMDSVLLLLGLVILAAVIFDFINGFHDTANAIATVIATRVLAPWQAILMAAALNFAGALSGTAVAKTIGSGLIDPGAISQAAVLAAILGAIFWNLFTWYYGIPSSSSHALVGGIVGAGFAKGGTSAVQVEGLEKIVKSLIVSPLIGFGLAFVFMIAILWIARGARPSRVSKLF